MNEERFVLTDDVWLRLAPHLPEKRAKVGDALRGGISWRVLRIASGIWGDRYR